MKNTNFSRIADRYDNNQYRQEISLDKDIANYFEQKKSLKEYSILDLACGTGLYMSKQVSLFKDKTISWHGLDASPEMLEKAKEKLIQHNNVALILGKAETLPYKNSTFDIIINNYAFHHFRYKLEVLDEITRVLKRDGILKMHNTANHMMKKWWIYQYFPNAYEEDMKRYWENEKILKELMERGFEAEIHIDYQIKTTKISDLLHFAENRDISVLTLIDDEDYYKGLEKMKEDIRKNPELEIINDFADFYCVAKKIAN